MTTPAGWYPDTEAPGQERYWNGKVWMDDRRPAQAPGPDAPPAPPAPPMGYVPQQQVVRYSDKKGKPIQATTAWIIAVVTLGYMLPWAIAATRGKSNAGSIMLINLLLGWTAIGWIVALVMACGAHQSGAVVVNR